MCELIPFLDGCRVPPWRADQSPPDVETCTTEPRCRNCESNKKQKSYVKTEVHTKKPRYISVPCPFVRQADDVRECRRSSRKSPWIGWLVLVSIFMAPLLGSAHAKVCQSIDVRNTPENLTSLTDCEVVEGFVRILLIESANSSAYANYTFPKLREITDYLLLYRAFELTTLATMFPNLAVIRGQNLFTSYALVIWEMNQMKEIGLPSLVDIMRGSVRIEKNDNLCFADTVDWNLIAPAGEGGHVIKANKGANLCSSCPAVCPLSKDTGKPLCWNHSHCQKKPLCDSRICYEEKKDSWKPCSEECVGGCWGPYNDQCFACKHVFDRDKCVSTCPIGTFLFRHRRCITMEECINVPKPPCGEKGHYKPFNKTCIEECPAGYQEAEVKGNITYKTCVQCNHTCPKVCPGQSVNNLATIQALRGCTRIDGALEISVNGANNIVAELEENLKNIEVVRDYVKIVRSYPLLDLGFLRNLKEITGVHLDQENALVVRDNENLQELFGNTTKLQILKGKLSFSFNARLCHRKILDLARQVGLNTTDTEVSRFTNGQKASCRNEHLEVEVVQISEYSAFFHIKNFRKYAGVSDHRQLLGYEYHHRETEFQNISKFGGRDACGNDGWITGDIRAEETEKDWEPAFISQLKPFTQYGFYFNTLMVPDESYFTRDAGNDTQPSGATSPIIYIRTKSGEPNPAAALHIVANTSSEMYITWKAPAEPNAYIAYYYVQIELIPDDGSQLAERNYCTTQLEAVPIVEKKSPVEEKIINQLKEKCCSCTAPGKQLSLRDEEESQKNSIDFENDLHNTVYVKRSDLTESCDQDDHVFPSLGRSRRDLGRYTREANEETVLTTAEPSDKFSETLAEIKTPSTTSTMNFVPPLGTTKTTTDSGEVISYGERINGTSLNIKNLRHFGNYRVTVRACRDDAEYEENKNMSQAQQCSKAQYETIRTKPKENADTIENSSVQIKKTNGTGSVLIEWKRPENPNGLIVTYTLFITSPIGWGKSECIPVKELRTERTESFLVNASQAGTWQFQLLATSLSGNGLKTQVFEFEVEEEPAGYVGWLVGMIFVLVICIVCYFVFLRWRRKKMDIPIIASFNPDYLSFPSADVYIPDEYEVAREQIRFVRELGQGSFGMVYEGILSGAIRTGIVENMKCAIKTVNEGASVRERIEFLNEASVMKAFVCNHVVKLLGVVSKGQPTYVVMELMANGDLKSFLRSLRPDNENSDSESSTRQPPTLKFILKMAIEIADGMAYLAAKKYVHRDLAARNCMVAEDLTVKIGDFGMTRDVYETDYYRKGGKGLLPVRWMSPESLKDGVFTSQSDVWSFGVVLWEMATLASQPYQGLSNEQVLKYVMDGGRMEMPEGCPEILYNLMLQCWRFQPKQRPRFVDVVEQLLPEVDSNFPEVSFYHSQEGQEFLLAERQERPVIHELPGEDEYGDPSSMRKNVPDQTVVEILDVDCPDDDDVVMSESHDEEEPLNPDGDFGDHAPLTYSVARRPFIDSAQTRNGNSHLPSTDSSKTASDSSKSGSHLSNGSVTNGYVNRRRDAPAEC